MSDGREEREHEKLRKQQEKPQDRQDQLDHDEEYDGRPERGGS